MSLTFIFEGAASASQRLERYGESIGSLWRVWDDIAAAFRRLEVLWFQTHGQGSWPELSPKYAAWKAVVYPGRPLMVREGELRDSLTVDGVISRSAGSLMLGTDVDHAKYHLGTRDPVAPLEMLEDMIAPDLQRFISYPGGSF